MDSREILIYFAIKNKGDWDAIYNDIKEKVIPEEEEVKKALSSINSKALTVMDEEYPESLERTHKTPFVLFYHGDISLLSDLNNKIAVVGSRKVSTYGIKMTNKLVGEIAKDFVVVSGLAYGVDACAHRAALNNGGRTIAVLGSGINNCYISDNEDIYEKCKEKHLVISEYPDKTEPSPENFPIRNRIIAGLCDTLLVTEGKMRSGTQITALLMTEKSGNVCCVPAHAGEDSICNYLIKEGAFLVETAQDIYDAAGIVSKKPVFE